MDWSLDSSCSGYEGDREEDSEAEKDGDCEYENELTPRLLCNLCKLGTLYAEEQNNASGLHPEGHHFPGKDSELSHYTFIIES